MSDTLVVTPASSPVAASVRNKRRRLFAGALVVSALLLAACIVFHRPLLTSVARAWTVSDPVSQADAVLVLGGGAEVRPFAAARFYKEGTVKKILVTSPPEKKTVMMGLQPAHDLLNREVLIRSGVPDADIEIIGNDSRNTWQESLALKEWLGTHPGTRIIIPTEAFHTRRTRWLFGKVLAGTGATVCIHALEAADYSTQDWWKHEEGLIAFNNEVLKHLYYRLRY